MIDVLMVDPFTLNHSREGQIFILLSLASTLHIEAVDTFLQIVHRGFEFTILLSFRIVKAFLFCDMSEEVRLDTPVALAKYFVFCTESTEFFTCINYKLLFSLVTVSLAAVATCRRASPLCTFIHSRDYIFIRSGCVPH